MKTTATIILILCGTYIAIFSGMRKVTNMPPLDAAILADCHSMESCAAEFLESLTEDQRSKVQFAFEDEERFNWHYFPKLRKGIALKELSQAQRNHMHALLQQGLSDQGYEKTLGIIKLEEVLRVLERRGDNDNYRDSEKYYISVFGEPSTADPWGWRFEGHHLSLNFSSLSQKVISVTPAFLGANPGIVPSGEARGTQVLIAEEEVARSFINALSSPNKEKAIIQNTAPSEIITGAARKASIGSVKGLSVREMSSEEKTHFLSLLEVYVHNMHPSIAKEQMAKINEAGIEHIHFAWAGSLSPGKGHYYRIHGPTVLIEYDNTQGGANHVHTVWRDLQNDFGEDLLRRHYDQHSHHQLNERN